MKKKYRIHKLRFTIFIALLALTAGLYAVHNLPSNQLKDLLQRSYEIISVKDGDTLWTIAADYSQPGADLRKTVYQISQLNEISDHVIYPGDELLIPVSSPEKAL